MENETDDFVEIRGAYDSVLRIGSPSGTREYRRIPFELALHDLTARGVIESTDWGGAAPRLVSFLEEMARDWRGWPGERTWRDDGPQVRLTATHDGKGIIALEVETSTTIGVEGPGTWTLRVVLALEPGSLDDLARSVARLLA
jgi:hypothetical protein